MKRTVLLLLAVNAAPALAEDTRQLDAHEHGVGALNIAIDGTTVAMEFHAPGADIVGFEYAAESEADRAAVDAAVATLARPLDLFVLPAAAACSVTQASAELESEQAHDDHDHHDHDAHKDHDDHAEHSGHEDHAEHSDHAAHAEEAGHSEFHAEYTLTCADPTALTEISFAYFDTFENARELEVQVIAGSGAQAFEVERDAPALDLRSLF
ncbi:DUF2796 domain-containing protein [uncultured Roseobacter sp.]|uniref:zinc uptake protein ZrgA n=1 Tax=uncultured Roseobacter sp. TaxID=114847 RepID=UPI0026128DF2|nr:DUF2796 domain-containing protein [uncultured Roseobacter sp.]